MIRTDECACPGSERPGPQRDVMKRWMSGERLPQLDALRGLAALSVVTLHVLLAVGNVPQRLDASPLHLLWAGHEAVIFFFVLSGFVLALPFVDGKALDYRSYAIKRFVRIWFPYACATAVTLLVATLLTRRVALGEWMVPKWNTVPTASAWFDHLLLIPDFDSSAFNPAIWSLVHELRISVIFPVIVWLARTASWQRCAMIGLAASTVGAVNLQLQIEPSLGWRTSFADSIHFSSMFLLGAVLARHRVALMRWCRARSRVQLAALVTAGLLAYTYSRGVRLVPSEAMRVVAELGIAAGVAVLLIFAISSDRLARWLSHPLLITNGNLSYSVYLWHSVVLFGGLHLLAGRLPIWAVVCIIVPTIGLVSAASYRWLEQPSIRWGRALVEMTRRRTPTPASPSLGRTNALVRDS